MRPDLRENGCRCADAELTVLWNSDVMLAMILGGQPHVAAGLARDSVSQDFKRASQLLAGQVTRQLHTASSSSRTKCRRTSFGA
jgi:hypothetical protein